MVLELSLVLVILVKCLNRLIYVVNLFVLLL